MSEFVFAVMCETYLLIAPLNGFYEALVAQVVVPSPLIGVFVNAEAAVFCHGRPVLRMQLVAFFQFQVLGERAVEERMVSFA